MIKQKNKDIMRNPNEQEKTLVESLINDYKQMYGHNLISIILCNALILVSFICLCNMLYQLKTSSDLVGFSIFLFVFSTTLAVISIGPMIADIKDNRIAKVNAELLKNGDYLVSDGIGERREVTNYGCLVYGDVGKSVKSKVRLYFEDHRLLEDLKYDNHFLCVSVNETIFAIANSSMGPLIASATFEK